MPEAIETVYHDMLARFGDTLEKTSEDVNKPGNSVQSGRYMTACRKPVVNFDKFKGEFIRGMALPEAPLSCDAFYMSASGELFLIEFKNGRIEAKKNFEIKVKIFESLLILLEKLDKTIEFTRRNLTFILVYNEDISHGQSQFDNTDGLLAIQHNIFALSRSPMIRFGLHRFKNIYFKEIYTYSRAEFEANFVLKFCKS
ncbi:hypothetical protein FACS1894109_19830 [Spirochaetia bacterium]|nr:hypothetical protein FACS1894109_19830 [Spirochaetia bacterium]